MRFFALLACVLAATACKQTAAPLQTPAAKLVLEPLGMQGSITKTRDLSRAEAHLLMASSNAIGGPCLTAREGAATVFGTLRDEGKRVLIAVPLSARGLPQAGSTNLGALDSDVSAMSCGTTKNMNVVAAAQLLDRGEAIVIAMLSHDAKSSTKPAELMRTPNHVTWLRVVSGATQSALFWVEEQADGRASLLAVGLGDKGSTGMAVRLATNIVGWHAQVHGDGFAIAFIADGQPKKKLIVQRYTKELAAAGSPQIVTSSDQFAGDLYGDSTSDFLVLGWAEGRPAQSRVSVVAESAVGRPVTIDREASELLGIASAPGGAYVVWRPRAQINRVRLARLHGRTDTLTAGLEIESEAKGGLEVYAQPAGLSLLGSFRVCPAGHCNGEFPLVPAFLRVSAALQVTEAHPIAVPMADGKREALAAPSLAWSLRCAAEDCVALSATGGAETRVFAHDLGPRTSLYTLSGALASSGGEQKAASVATETVLEDVPVVDYAAVGSGDSRAVVSLREAESKRARGLDVVLDVWSPRKTMKIANGASATGQISLTRDVDGSFVAVWTESDLRASALRLMRVTKDGRVLRDVRLAPSSGDKSHVTLVKLVDDPKSDRKWLLLWVDSRRKHGEVFGMALNGRLRRVGPEQRLVESGDVDSLSAHLDGKRLWLAFSAQGESDRDVYRAAVDSQFTTVVAPSKVAATVTDSYAPHFRVENDALSLVWVERPVGNLGAKDNGAYGAWAVSIDRATGSIGSPQLLLGSATIGEALADDHHLWLLRGGQSLTLERMGTAHQIFSLTAEAPFEPIVQPIDNGLYFLDTGSKPALRRLKFAQ